MNSKLKRLYTHFARLLFAACLVLPGLAAAEDAAPGAAAAPLGVEEHDSGAEVTLLECKRTSGDTVTVKWLYKNGGEEKKRIEPLISEDYYLVDAAAKKKYFAVKDSSGKWVAGTSRGYNSVELEPGKTYKMWAKFPAPPAATEKVTVYIVGVPPFEDVPIAK
jgi:hypothetical protein